jgi:hypothetical protein
MMRKMVVRAETLNPTLRIHRLRIALPALRGMGLVEGVGRKIRSKPLKSLI